MLTVRVVVNVVLAVAVAVGVVALLRTDVLHLVDGAALGAALDGAVAGGGEPDDNVRVGRVAGATLVLLVTEGLDNDGVLHRACVRWVVSIDSFRSSGSWLAKIEHAVCRKWNSNAPKGACFFLTQASRNRFRPITVYVPFLLASSGLRSKMSTPCIFPRISRRSRPVACSMSVGMVPGAAPVLGRRSCSLVISAVGVVSAGGTLSRGSSRCSRSSILQVLSLPVNRSGSVRQD